MEDEAITLKEYYRWGPASKRPDECAEHNGLWTISPRKFHAVLSTLNWKLPRRLVYSDKIRHWLPLMIQKAFQKTMLIIMLHHPIVFNVRWSWLFTICHCLNWNLPSPKQHHQYSSLMNSLNLAACTAQKRDSIKIDAMTFLFPYAT